jgi:hypothetical protein
VTGTAKITGATTLGATTISTSSSTALAINSSASACYLGMSDSSGSFTYLGSDNGAMLFQTPASSYSTKMTLDASGNLGLGVTPSAWSGYKSLDFTGGSLSSGSTNNIELWSNAYFNGTNGIYRNNGLVAVYSQGNGAHRWLTAPSGTAGNAITFTQAMTLDASGRLGLGATTPTPYSVGALVLNILSSNANSEIKLTNSTTGNAAGAGLLLAQWGVNALLTNASSGYLLFGTGDLEAARITSSRNLHIGTFSADSGEKLQVTGTAKITAATTIGLTSTTGYSLVVQNSGATDATGIRLTSGGTDNGYFITAYNSVSKYASLQAGDNTAYRSIILNALGGNVGIGTNSVNASARFQVDSTTQGVLPPRMTTTQKNAIASPAAGLIVYDTTSNKLCCYNGTTWNDLF